MVTHMPSESSIGCQIPHQTIRVIIASLIHKDGQRHDMGRKTRKMADIAEAGDLQLG